MQHATLGCVLSLTYVSPSFAYTQIKQHRTHITPYPDKDACGNPHLYAKHTQYIPGTFNMKIRIRVSLFPFKMAISRVMHCEADTIAVSFRSQRNRK